MSWSLYLLTFKLKSPLHIGFHKVANLSRTRAYIPARTFWGALTAKLTRKLKSSNYREVGEFLKNTIRFGYFYISDGNNIFIPKYTDEGLKFGELPQVEFEKRFIRSFISTSVEPYSLTAEEGTLHEIEFISSYELGREDEEPKPVFIKGVLWVSELLESRLKIHTDENDFSIFNNEKYIKFSDLVNKLQIGGERRYGFGQIEIYNIERIHDQNLGNTGFKGIWKEYNNEIELELKENDFIWSHVKFSSDLEIKGSIEPLVGRDWSDKGAGRELRFHGFCWTPGSILVKSNTFKVTKNFGLWEQSSLH